MKTEKHGPHIYKPHISHCLFNTGTSTLDEARIPPGELFAYLGALIKEKGGKPIIINGVDDHVHLLILLPPDVCVSEAMKFAKANSPRWMKERFGKPFAWQKGFGASSVSRSNVPAVSRYIADQEAHHAKMDSKTEFVTLLKKNGVDFDEEFLCR